MNTRTNSARPARRQPRASSLGEKATGKIEDLRFQPLMSWEMGVRMQGERGPENGTGDGGQDEQDSPGTWVKKKAAVVYAAKWNQFELLVGRTHEGRFISAVKCPNGELNTLVDTAESEEEARRRCCEMVAREWCGLTLAEVLAAMLYPEAFPPEIRERIPRMNDHGPDWKGAAM